jgi:uncharacterized membrane protein
MLRFRAEAICRSGSRVIRPGLASLGTLLSLCVVVACAAEQEKPSPSATYSYQCDGAAQTIVVILSGDRGHLFSREASQPLRRDPGARAFVGDDVYYLPDQSPDLAPGQSAQITIMGNSYRDCKNDARAAVWEAAKLRGVSYRAVGQEPPWILEIDRENGFFLSTGYAGDKLQFPYTEPVSDPVLRSGRYVSELDDERIGITIIGQPCRDSMSGEAFSTRVEIEWRGQTLRGCGRALH